MGVDQDFINLAVFLIGSAAAVTGIRHIRVDGTQAVIQIVEERMAYQTVHRLRRNRQIVGQGTGAWQIAWYNDLTSKRHVGTGEVVSLCQRVSHEGRLRTTGTVTETGDDDWQIVITYETGNTVVNYSHGEQCRSTFFGLHTAG